MDSCLGFKTHIKKVCKKVKFNLVNFRLIRNSLSKEAAKVYFHSMILSHITYCLTSWFNTHDIVLKPLELLYKQALKILDKKQFSFHHCHILNTYNLLSWENISKFKNVCLVYKIMPGSAPPPLADFIKFKSIENRVTRGAAKGDCIIPYRKTLFGQAIFSFRASHLWNSIPQLIRECTSFKSFKHHFKKLLLNNQQCEH